MCADHFAVLDDPPKPVDLIEHVLEGLVNTKFKSVVDHVNDRDTLITFDELHEKLLLKEGTLMNPSPPPILTTLPATAHATSTRHYPAAATSSRPSHFASKSSYPHKPSNSNEKNKPTGYKGKCQWCRALGHSSYRCSAFQQQFPNAKPSLPPSNSTPPPQPHVATTELSPTFSLGSWTPVLPIMTPMISPLSLSLHHPYDSTEEIVIGNGSGVPITHTGSITLFSTPSKSIHLSNVLSAPTMHRNIISVSQLCLDNDHVFEFSSSSLSLKDRLTGAHILTGQTKHGV